MGMFDTIKCYFPLPGAPEEIQNSSFQTKDLNNLLDNYTITYEGRLIHHSMEWNSVEEKDRPYYGKPEWDSNPIFRIFGSLSSKFLGDIDTDYHGKIRIYTSSDNSKTWYEYELKFTDGTIVDVRRIMEKENYA
jgi:hypothetical protein